MKPRHGDLRGATLTAVLSILVVFSLFILMGGYQGPQTEPQTALAARSTIGPQTPPSYDIEHDGIPVLCHHFLRKNTGPLEAIRILGALFFNLPLLDDMDVWTQTVGAFEKQMRYLHEQGFQSVDLDDMVAWQEGSLKLPSKSVVITFDDGDRSAKLAAPILERYGFKATLFIVTGKVGVDWEGLEILTWDEIRELHDSGTFSVQSHTHDLHYHVKTAEGHMPVLLAASNDLYDMPGAGSWRQQVLDDLRESRRLIMERLGTTPRFLAWPYGFANSELDSIAVAAGFDAACSLREGTNRPADRRQAAPRASWSGVDPRFPATIPFFDFSFSARRPTAAHSWERYEVNRLTITARTSRRGFAAMLAAGAHPARSQPTPKPQNH